MKVERQKYINVSYYDNFKHLRRDMTKSTKWVYAQRRLRSAWADQTGRVPRPDGRIRPGGCPGWSESSLGAHSFCWFCHVAAHFTKWSESFTQLVRISRGGKEALSGREGGSLREERNCFVPHGSQIQNLSLSSILLNKNNTMKKNAVTCFLHY